ncbi:MAG: S1 family peptidase [Pyrinomonadaceae bacterium]
MSTGTGFFCRFLESEDRYFPAIVTNKHVVKGSVYGQLWLNLADANGQHLAGRHESFRIGEFESAWIKHPDPEVDLCILLIGEIVNNLRALGKNLYFISLDKSLILTSAELAELTALEEIVMIGYPNGIWDSVNNMPIIRRGITATHPNLPYNGKQEFMIDAACFPGSSGSPIFLFNVGGYVTKSGNVMLGSSRIKLLGILYAGPQHTATGEIEIVNVPTQQRAVAFSRIPNNLGLVIKAQKLLDFEEILQERIRGAQNSSAYP